jgi:hypothetical protein
MASTPPSSEQLASLLPSDPSREAVDATRGFEWQRWMTARAWLALAEDEALWIEWGEDFTVATIAGARTVQARNRGDKVTLGTEKTRDGISHAFLRSGAVQTVLWTTAEPGLERGDPFGEPGIVHWQKVAAGEAAPDSLRTFLERSGALADDAAAVVKACDDDALRLLLGRVVWVTGEPALDGIRATVRAATAERVRSISNISELALRNQAFAERLVAELAVVGLRPDRVHRRLTREELDRVLLFEIYEMAAALLPSLIAGGPDVARGQALSRRIADLRSLAGFHSSEEDPFAGWRAVAADLLDGRYSAVPADILHEALARTAWALSDETVGRGLAPRLLAQLEGTAETTVSRLARLSVSTQGDIDAALRALRDQRTPEALGMQFALMTRDDQVNAALDWAMVRHAPDFSAIGVFHILYGLMTEGRWPEALRFSEGVTRAQKEERPILHTFCGVVHMADVMAPPSRGQLLPAPLPMHPNLLRDRFDASAPQLGLRLSLASNEFADAERAAQSLERTEHVAVHQDLQTWMDLENPDRASRTRELLKQRLSAGERFSSSVAFASVYDLEFDRAGARRQFDGHLSLGGFEQRDFRALLVLFDEPQARLAVVDRHLDALKRFLGSEQAAEFRIDQLIQCGRLDEAEAALAEAETAFSGTDNLQRLRAGLQTQRGENASDGLAEVWARTGDVEDLELLCRALGHEKRWPALAEKAELLASQTRDPRHIGIVCDAYNHLNLTSKMVATLDTYPAEVEASADLRPMHALLLIRAGRFTEAAVALERLMATPGRDDADDDRMLLELALDRGDWEAISGVVDRIWQQRDTRSARRLIEGATLAMDRGLDTRAHELTIAATAASDADAAVFMTAWLIANALGHDLDWPEVQSWLSGALERSGPEGPVWQTTLEEAVEVLPQQGRRRAEVAEKVNRGEAPLFAVAEALNLTLTDLVLGAALRNAAERDPRRRWLIPTVQGGRPPVDMQAMTRIAFDITSLLALQALNLVPATLQRFVVVLPTGTLRKLFEERQHLQLHAPRRAKQAGEVLRLAGQRGLIATPLVASRDLDLVASVGEEIADLLGHGRALSVRVCRPGPVPRPGSLRMEPVDMTDHMDVLCSTLDIVEYLHGAGRLERLRYEAAKAQLTGLDTGWLQARPIHAGETVILDALALNYLQISGLLEATIEAFGGVSVPADVLKEARADVEVGQMIDTLVQQVDQLRRSLRDGINNGAVIVAPSPDEAEPEERHPTFRLLRIRDVDAFVIDDRKINSSWRVTLENGEAPLATSLDVAEALGKSGTITFATLKAAAADVMSHGFLFMPVTLMRVMADLVEAVASGAFHETAELRILREYLQRVGMAHQMVLPPEAVYFDGVARTVVEAIRKWWIDAPDVASADAGATWLYAILPDPRALQQVWTDAQTTANAEDILVSHLSALLLPNPSEADRMAGFQAWAERTVAAPLGASRPDLLSRVAHRIADKFVEFDAAVGEPDA